RWRSRSSLGTNGLCTYFFWIFGVDRMGFLPGEFGFCRRGDCSFDSNTMASSSSFGTCSRLHRPSRKVLNSGVFLNSSSLKGGGYVSPGPVSLCGCRSAMCHLPILADQLIVSKPASDNVAQIPIGSGRGGGELPSHRWWEP